MDKSAVPTTYVRSVDCAREMAAAEQKFRNVIYIHDTILAHFDEVLQDAKELADEYNEHEHLAVPVSYDYLTSLFDGDDYVDGAMLEHVLAKVFISFMEEYGYHSDTIVPTLPLVYIKVYLRQYNTFLEKYMSLAAKDAERIYTASMN